MARSSDSNFLLALFRDKTFQVREIRRVVLISCLYLVITTVLVGLFYQQLLGQLLEGMAPLLFVSEDIALTSEAVPTLSSVLGKWLIAMLVANALIAASLGVYITRKLGHPIMAIKRTLRELGDGNLDVRLRSNDYMEFGEITDELTKAVTKIRTQIHTAQAGINNVGEVDTATPNVQQLNQAINDCRQALDYFQTDSANEDFNKNKAA